MPFWLREEIISSSLIFTRNKADVEWMHDEQISNSAVPGAIAVYPIECRGGLHFKSFADFNELQRWYQRCVSASGDVARVDITQFSPCWGMESRDPGTPAGAYEPALTDVGPYTRAAGLRHFKLHTKAFFKTGRNGWWRRPTASLSVKYGRWSFLYLSAAPFSLKCFCMCVCDAHRLRTRAASSGRAWEEMPLMVEWQIRTVNTRQQTPGLSPGNRPKLSTRLEWNNGFK